MCMMPYERAGGAAGFTWVPVRYSPTGSFGRLFEVEGGA